MDIMMKYMVSRKILIWIFAISK